MQRICVFTGSNKGVRPEYAQGAYTLGQELARRKPGLVYGGGSVKQAKQFFLIQRDTEVGHREKIMAIH